MGLPTQGPWATIRKMRYMHNVFSNSSPKEFDDDDNNNNNNNNNSDDDDDNNYNTYKKNLFLYRTDILRKSSRTFLSLYSTVVHITSVSCTHTGNY